MSKKPTPGLYGVIDIGTKTVKAIVIEANNKGLRLLNIESVEIASFDTFTDEDRYDDQIREAISKLANNLNLTKCKKIISLYYNRELQVKLLDFPNTVGTEQLNQALPWEAKKLLSPHYKDEQFTYSYCITRGNPLSVALAVVPQPLLDNHLRLFNKTGIKPDSVYTDVFATLALQPIIDIAGLPALSVVNFGYSGTHLNIFSAGKLKFYRYIPTGTSEMTNPPRENELEMYSQKIRFSFDYFRAVSKLNQVDSLFFMGGGTSIPNVLTYEQNYFSPTRISALDVSSKIDISPIMSSNLSDGSNPKDSISSFIPAIGACLADFRDDSDNMDLLNLIKQQEKEKNLEKIANSVPIVLGIISLILSTGILYYLYQEKDERLANLTVELKSVDDNLKEYEEKLQKKTNSQKSNPIRLSKNSLELVKSIINNKNSLSYLFKVIPSVKKNIQISNILIRNRQEAEQINLKTKEELDNENMAFTVEENNYSNNDYQQESTVETNDPYAIFSEPPKESKKQHKKEKITKNNKPIVYESKLSVPISEEQIKEDYEGKIVIIHGFAKDATEVSEFSDSLTANLVDKDEKTLPSAILKYIGISLRKIDNKVEFLLKGEMR